MKRIPVLLVIVCLLLLSACGEYIESPEPVNNQKGYVIAGETSDHVTVWDFQGYSVFISGESGYPHGYAYTLDSATNANISVGCSYSSYMNDFYASAGVNITEGLVEVAMMKLADTTWVCYNLSPDSTTGTIVYFNSLSGMQFSGDLHVNQIDTIQSPIAYPSETRIDASLPWTSGYGRLCMRNDYRTQVGGPDHPDIRHINTMALWLNHPGKQYIAFRLRDSDHYRYGYMKMEVYDYSTARIHSIVLENL